MSPLLQENGRTPAAYVGDANSLFWNFISFPCKPSYSASFLHWIFSLSYPYLTTLYIFNSIVSWSPKPSPLRNPWLHWGWTPVGDPSSIPGLGRYAGEEIGYSLLYSWASLVAQLIKNLFTVWETWAWSLGWKDPLEKGTPTHSSTLPWRIP